MEESPKEDTFVKNHSFGVFITIVMLITAVLVYIALSFYYSSGAAQLDLSRPGYVSVSSKITTDGDDYPSYAANGDISVSVIDDFRELFIEQSDKAKTAQAFGDDPLNLEALGLD